MSVQVREIFKGSMLRVYKGYMTIDVHITDGKPDYTNLPKDIKEAVNKHLKIK